MLSAEVVKRSAICRWVSHTVSRSSQTSTRARPSRTCPEERGPRKKAALDFTLYASLRTEQIRSNTSRASAIDSKDGCGFRPALDPLPE